MKETSRLFTAAFAGAVALAVAGFSTYTALGQGGGVIKTNTAAFVVYAVLGLCAWFAVPSATAFAVYAAAGRTASPSRKRKQGEYS